MEFAIIMECFHNEKYNVLITSHPQFKNKNKFTQYISDWIRNK